MTKSQIEKGADNVERLRKFLQVLNGKPLPNRTAIARMCDFDRQVLYQNPAAVALLEEYERSPSEPSPLNGQFIEDKPVSNLPKGVEEEIKKRMDRLVAEVSSLRSLLAESEAKCLALRRQLEAEQGQRALRAETGMTLRNCSIAAEVPK